MRGDKEVVKRREDKKHDNKIESEKLQIAINEVHSSFVIHTEWHDGQNKLTILRHVNIHFVLRLLHLSHRYRTRYRVHRGRN